jgi:hypothetical protein
LTANSLTMACTPNRSLHIACGFTLSRLTFSNCLHQCGMHHEGPGVDLEHRGSGSVFQPSLITIPALPSMRIADLMVGIAQLLMVISDPLSQASQRRDYPPSDESRR